jgi:hypothetical protein
MIVVWILSILFTVWVCIDGCIAFYRRVRRNQITPVSPIENWLDGQEARGTRWSFQSEEERAAQMADPSSMPPEDATPT